MFHASQFAPPNSQHCFRIWHEHIINPSFPMDTWSKSWIMDMAPRRIHSQCPRVSETFILTNLPHVKSDLSTLFEHIWSIICFTRQLYIVRNILLREKLQQHISDATDIRFNASRYQLKHQAEFELRSKVFDSSPRTRVLALARTLVPISLYCQKTTPKNKC